MSGAGRVFESAVKQAMEIFKGNKINMETIAKGAEQVLKEAKKAAKRGG